MRTFTCILMTGRYTGVFAFVESLDEAWAAVQRSNGRSTIAEVDAVDLGAAITAIRSLFVETARAI